MARITMYWVKRAVQLYLEPESTWREVERKLQDEGFTYQVKRIVRRVKHLRLLRPNLANARCQHCKKAYVARQSNTTQVVRGLCPKCKEKGVVTPNNKPSAIRKTRRGPKSKYE